MTSAEPDINLALGTFVKLALPIGVCVPFARRKSKVARYSHSITTHSYA